METTLRFMLAAQGIVLGALLGDKALDVYRETHLPRHCTTWAAPPRGDTTVTMSRCVTR